MPSWDFTPWPHLTLVPPPTHTYTKPRLQISPTNKIKEKFEHRTWGTCSQLARGTQKGRRSERVVSNQAHLLGNRSSPASISIQTMGSTHEHRSLTAIVQTGYDLVLKNRDICSVPSPPAMTIALWSQHPHLPFWLSVVGNSFGWLKMVQSHICISAREKEWSEKGEQGEDFPWPRIPCHSSTTALSFIYQAPPCCAPLGRLTAHSFQYLTSTERLTHFLVHEYQYWGEI